MSTAVFLVFCVAASALGQATGTLIGTVRTPTGEPVGNVVVTATGETGVVRVRTDVDGEYRLEGLAAAEYTITTDQAPLVAEPLRPIAIASGITIRRDLTLVSPDRLSGDGWRADRLVEANPGLSASLFERRAIDHGRAPLTQIVERVPGISVARAGGIGHPTALRVRGAPASDRFQITDGLPLDDLAHRLHLGGPGVADIVEVVRGAPHSALGTELTGVAHLATQSVDDTGPARFAFDTEGGALGWRRLGVSTAGTRGDYDWSLGARNLGTDNDQANSQYSQTAVAGTFGIRRGDKSAHFILRGETSKLGLPGQTLFLPIDLDATEERTQWITGATLRLHRGPTNKHELRLVASQTNRGSFNPFESDPGALQSGDEVALRIQVPDFASSDRLRNDTQVARLTYEYTLVGDEFHTIVFGGTVEGQSGRFGLSNAFDHTRLNLALFGEDRMQAWEGLQVTVGGRFARHGAFGFTPLPRGSLTYELGRGFIAHGSGGFSLGTPTLEQRFGETFELRGSEDLFQAKSAMFDGGVAGSLFGGRLGIDLTAFQHRYDNLIVPGAVDVPGLSSVEAFRQLTLAAREQLDLDVRAGLRGPLTAVATDVRTGYVNVPRSRAYGLEVTLTGTPIPQVELEAVYAFTDSKVTEGRGQFRPGQALSEVPKHHGTLAGDVQLGKVSVGATMRFVGARRPGIDFISRVLGVAVLESYTRWDARGQVQLGDQVAVSVVAENLTDEDYQDVLGYPALGRLVRAGLHVSF